MSSLTTKKAIAFAFKQLLTESLLIIFLSMKLPVNVI